MKAPGFIFVLVGFATTVGAVAPVEAGEEAFTMKIMDAFAITGSGTVLTGQVATGFVETGQTVCVPMQSGETLSRKVAGIEQFRKVLERVEAGQMAGIIVAGIDARQVDKGAELHSDCDPPNGESQQESE